MRYFPPEWHKQRAILMAFPHKNSDWSNDLQSAYSIFVKIASAISFKEKLIILIPEDEREKIKNFFCIQDKITFLNYETNDTWIRDFGPICTYENGNRVINDFIFNAWGEKYEFEKDNLVNEFLYKNYIFYPSKLKKIDFVLEGGSIDSDGAGTILTTSKCLLNKNRNKEYSKEKIEEILYKTLGADRVLWLNYGFLEGDDTDSHIDMLARFVSRETIVYVKCENKDDLHYEELSKMEEELQNFRQKNGAPYNLVPLPLPKPIYKDGKRLPASYVNFLITNHAVILPIYKDENDKKVINIFKELFPKKEIIPLDSRRLIEEGGSIHCSTMQIPYKVEE